MKKYLIQYVFILLEIMSCLGADDTQLSPLNYLDFEGEIPDCITVSKGKVSLSSNHRIMGAQALRWDYQQDDRLFFRGEVGYQPQEIASESNILGSAYSDSNDPVLFKLPLYSDTPQKTTLRVKFGTDDRVDCFIDIKLAFQGWRKFVIPYDRGHLRGTPRKGMNFVEFEVMGSDSGTVYLDVPVFAYRSNPRGIGADPLVPSLKYHPQRFGPYGSCVKQEWQLNCPWFSLEEHITESQVKSFQVIEDRLYELEWGGKNKIEQLSDGLVAEIQKAYDFFQIERSNGCINGVHLDSTSNRGKLNKLVKKIGVYYQQVVHPEQKVWLKTLGIDLIEHGIDVDDKLDWYFGRGFADGCYLLKDELRRDGLLDDVISFLHRKYAFPRFYNEDVVNGRHDGPSFGSDELYTNSIGFILCVLIMNDSPEKVRDMQHFVSFYSNIALNFSSGLTDTFKPDGSHYHHANAALTRYGAYTMPVVSKVIRILSKTDFRIYQEAHERMKQNVLIRRFYRSRKYFPWSFSHNRIRPLENHNFEDSLHLAFAGSPDGKERYDLDMAAVYLRMMPGDELPEEAKIFGKMGVLPEVNPNGHHTLSYYAKGIHRYQDWMAVVGAHSRYIFQKEHWTWHATRGNVKFGMFENWGNLELIYPDNPELNQINNGRSLEGWDWTQIPGVTSIDAPLDRIKLQTVKRGDDSDEEHLRSDQAFVGGLDSSTGNGIFVSKIRGHHKYNLESFYATKSWFFFGDLIVCLGSDIRNDLPEYVTHTCLFQNAVDKSDFKLYHNDVSKVADLRSDSVNPVSSDQWIVDSRKIGYFIPSGQNLNLSYGLQLSRCYQDRLDTEGMIEKAWLTHGHAPESAFYEYAVKMDTTPEGMESFSRKQKNDSEYHVILANDSVHAVRHPASETLECIAFEANYDLNFDLLKGISHSGLLMLKKHQRGLMLAVSDPDLRFYEGFSSDVDIQLNRHELPSYANHWHGHRSIPSKIKVFLYGHWKLLSVLQGNGKILWRRDDITVVEFDCRDGLTNEILLFPED